MPRTFRYSRPKSSPSESLCVYLARKFSYFTVSEWEQQIKDGYLSINDPKKPMMDPYYELQQQDCITYAPPPTREPDVDLQHIEVLYTDADVMVCVKNGNLPVTEGGRYCENTLCSFLNRGGAEGLGWKTPSHHSQAVLQPSQKEVVLPVSLPACGPASTTLITETNTNLNTNASTPHSRFRTPSSSSVTLPGTMDDSLGSGVAHHRHDLSDTEPYSGTPLYKKHRSEVVDHGGEATVPCAATRKGGVSPAGSSVASTFYPVHRLDKETSGLLVMGRSAHVTQRLSAMFEEQSKELTNAVESHLSQKSTPLRDDHDPLPMCRDSLTALDSSLPLLTSEKFDCLKSGGQKQVEKEYVAVLSGEAVAGAVHVVVTRIGTMGDDPVWKADPQHQKLLKLKMVCYPLTSSPASEILASDPHPHNDCVKPQTFSECGAMPTMEDRSRGGRIAVSRITILSVDETLHASVARIEILTGRTHQIRVHCAHIGYPVLGDKLYSTKTPGVYGGSYAVSDEVYLERVRSTKPFLQDPIVPTLSCRRHLLHAAKLAFPHPNPSLDGKKMLNCRSSPLHWFLLDVNGEENVILSLQTFLEKSLNVMV